MVDVYMEHSFIEQVIETDEYYISDEIFFRKHNIIIQDNGKMYNFVRVSSDDTEMDSILLYKKEMI